MKIITRRTFLKSIGLIGSALLIAPRYILSKPKPQMVFVGPRDTASYKTYKTLAEARLKVPSGSTIYVMPN